ncbi:hypothetical protein EDC30_101298 [Paucimonas lemoignei]|uniref:Uncharacterized protein n=1 Tax=Paucimonas lemoignei TaxID=29443 RepID=A0A4R3I1D8_PAULE|nr:hypothetical protein [Paucimonas lemoignei]TCS39342.1 hypothetical protein EDC30_101298 [Paucimonas lemoignei]
MKDKLLDSRPIASALRHKSRRDIKHKRRLAMTLVDQRARYRNVVRIVAASAVAFGFLASSVWE